MNRIILDNVGLTFKLKRHGRITLKEFLVRQMYRKGANPYLKVRALRNLNLEINEGDRLGILGHNGAGKSTLLKLLAGVYPPTRGKMTVEGRVSSLFDIRLGFEMEANGWENIAFRGYLQGETPRSLRPKIKSIAEFSELGDFLNMPVRYYSSGMMVRLAFSIATAIEPEILLVDEVLGAGDMAFQTKARQRMQDMMAKARLIVLVSHDMESLTKFCTKGVWMDHGHARLMGPMPEVVEAYSQHMNAKQDMNTQQAKAA